MVPSSHELLIPGSRWATPDDDEALMGLVALCHPTRPARTPLYYRLHPSVLVWREGLIAYATLSMTPSLVLLYDTGVHPAARRRGYAAALLAERLRLGLINGCQLAAGGVEAENGAMRALLLSAGFDLAPSAVPLSGPMPCTALLFDDRTRAWLTRQYTTNALLRKE